jgi:hypothetical protein
MSPPTKGLARRIPVEIERVTLVVNDLKRLAPFDGLAAREIAIIRLTT